LMMNEKLSVRHYCLLPIFSLLSSSSLDFCFFFSP
jgi:hypothetical protein